MNNQENNTQIKRDLSSAVMQDQVRNFNDNEVFQPAEHKEPVSQEDIASKVEEFIKEDLATIRSLMTTGILTVEQGQTLMKQVVQNAYNSIITKQNAVNEIPVTEEPKQVVISEALSEFVQSNPDYFNKSGRDELLNYLKNSNLNFDKDELLQISKLVEALEAGAVERYLKKIEYGKILNDENAIAKQRLRANAQLSNAADTQRVFTRAQIGKMSGDEFTKNEAAIMEQLRRGLIQ